MVGEMGDGYLSWLFLHDDKIVARAQWPVTKGWSPSVENLSLPSSDMYILQTVSVSLHATNS